MSTETAQINARINRTLKERGDAALEHAGYTPSQAIRNLWDFAARNAHNPRAIRTVSYTHLDVYKRQGQTEGEK